MIDPTRSVRSSNDSPEIDALLERLHALEAEVTRLSSRPDPAPLERRIADLELQAERAPRPVAPSGPSPAAEASGDRGSIDRRRLLGKAGAAAVGAVIGGTALSVTNASPAAAATAAFDSNDGTPALTATSTGGGAGIVVNKSGTASNAGIRVDANALGVEVVTTDARALDITAQGTAVGSAVRVSGGVAGIISAGSETGVLGLGGGGATGYGVAGWAEGSEAGVQGMARGTSDGGHFSSEERIGLVTIGGQAQLALSRPGFDLAMVPPRTRTDAHIAGEVYLDDDQSLWLCTADGNPGAWVRITGSGAAGALQMLPSPVRVYDTRPGAPPTGVGPKTPLATGTPRTGIALGANSSTVPTDATAAIISLTVTNTTGGSPSGPAYLGVYADGATYTGTSNINWTSPGSTIAVTTTTALGPGATIAAFASHPTDLIIDVIAYYR